MASEQQHPVIMAAAIAAIITIPISLYGIFQAHADSTIQDQSGNLPSSQPSPESHPPSSSASSGTPPVATATVIGSIHVQTTAATNAGDDVILGKNLYQLSSNGAVYVYYSWMLRNSDSTASSESLCQMLIKLEGPEDHAAFRSGDCSHEYGDYISQPDNMFELKTPGNYTLTVHDELHHVYGRANFKVIEFTSSR